MSDQGTGSEQAPSTATEVAQHLARLARELNDTVEGLRQAEGDHTAKRAAYDLAYSKAFLNADGSMDLRKHQAVIETQKQREEADVAEVLVKHQAVIETQKQREEADVAEVLVRHLRRQVDSLRVRIDVGRSYGAAVRAELSALVGGDQ